MGVSQLAYVGINITDVAAWRHLATDILGMEERKRKGGGPLYYRVGRPSSSFRASSRQDGRRRLYGMGNIDPRGISTRRSKA